MATVDDPTLLRTMFYLWERMKLVVEPTGALAAAAALEGTTPIRGLRVGVILSGGNVDLSQVGGWMKYQMRRSSFAVRRSTFVGSTFVVRRCKLRRRVVHPRHGAAGFRGARRRAGHLPANQRRLHHRPDRRPGRPGARRHLEAGHGEGRPDAVSRPRRRLSRAVGRVERVQGRAHDRRPQRRRPRPRHPRQPRVRLRRRCADSADARGDVPMGGLERGRYQHRPADRRRRALPGQAVRHDQGRLHRPVPEHAGDHQRQAETHAGSRIR